MARPAVGAVFHAVAFATLVGVLILATSSQAAPEVSQITIQASELGGGPIAEFKYLVNEDNVGDPADPNPLNHPGRHPMASDSPLAAAGDQSSATLTLPDGRYIITVQGDDPATPDMPFDYKLWGKHIKLPADAGAVAVELKKFPLPLPNLVVHAFQDNRFVNSAPDLPGELGLAGFQVIIKDQGGAQVIVDHNGDPLCGGQCVTGLDGSVTIEALSPAWYEVELIPPDDSWIQTSTFEGGFPVGVGLEEGSDGHGAPLDAIVEPGLLTAQWFGFVQEMDWASPGGGTINGTARTWVEWPPFADLSFGEPVPEPYVALSNMATDEQVWTGRGAPNGDFTIPNVPAGSYQVAIWDYDLQWIIRLFVVEVAEGETVALGDVGVSRWFGWLSGDVYLDTNRSGIRDPGEVGLPNSDLDVRWRDGSVDAATLTDPTGHYEYPQAEGGAVGRFQIGEVGFGLRGTTGASLHDEYNPSLVTQVPSDLSGGLLTNQFSQPTHRSIVDWGKYNYGPTESGPIVGIVFQGVTRNELDARLQAAEDYETGIADATVRVWGLGADAEPNTADDELLNEVGTDRWGQPSNCDVLDKNGVPLADTANVGPGCIEVPSIGIETKDGAFDGGYAIGDACAPVGAPVLAGGDLDGDGIDNDEDPEPRGNGQPLGSLLDENNCAALTFPEDYVVQGVTPENYQITREEDVNVNDGDDLVPQILPAACTGDLRIVNVKSPDGTHASPDSYPASGGAPASTPADAVDNPTFALQELANPNGGSPYEGQVMPLCDKRLVTLQQGQNPEANFFFFPENGLQNPGRILGLVTDDIYFDTNPNSMWYGEARPIRDVPVGIRDFENRLITTLTTDENGYYEVLLPSTQTIACPIPQGVCPGLYRVVVNDPGSKQNPNTNFNPNYLTAAVTFDVWPGKTTQADTPLDPISGVACVMPAGIPEFFSVDKVTIPQSATGAARQITIRGLNFGPGPASPAGQRRVRIEGPVGRNLVLNSWSQDSITATVPALGTTGTTVRPGAYELTVRSSAGRTAINGITLHVTGTSPSPAYTPTFFPVLPPTSVTAKPLQAGIDAAEASSAANRIVLVNPGVYTENVIVSERIKLQGFGPGGIVGADGVGVEDPRRNVPGSVIDGRFWTENSAGWYAKLNGLGPLRKDTMEVPGGADVTVVAKMGSQGDFTGSFRAQIDGFGLTSARAPDPFSAGGIYVHAQARNLLITNDIVEGNSGTSSGGIGLGQPGQGTNTNTGIEIRRNRIIGNGGYLDTGGGGGIGIHHGANNYDIRWNQICANFSVHYGGGISHFGRSDNGTIRDNLVNYNDAIDEGGGIQIAGQPSPTPGVTLGERSGDVTIERNLIQGNASNDDGGGIHLLEALQSVVTIQNNMIVNNHAADIGGGMSVDDSARVRFVNNTVAYNDTTASAEDSTPGVPRAAGFTSTRNSDLFQAQIANGIPGSPTFSRPQAFFNNIFWQNLAWTFDIDTQTLTPVGNIDLEVVGTLSPQFLDPRYSILSVAYPGGSNNVVADPNFVDDAGAQNELMVQINRLSPAEVMVTLVRGDPPEGLPFDYHLTAPSPAIGTGVTSQPNTWPPPASINGPSDDYDRANRPGARDRGADEVSNNNQENVDKFRP